MITIQESTLMLLGRQIPLYGLTAVLGATILIVLNAFLAHRRRLDASFAFRVSLVSLYGGAVFQTFLQGLMPNVLLQWAYAAGALALPLLFYTAARLFWKDTELSSLGAVSCIGYGVVTRCCCFFGGCCYGPPWSGFPALVYGEKTANPLPGTPLFPLQPLQAAVSLALLVAAAVIFLKKRPKRHLYAVMILSITVYYAGLFVSPAGQKTVALIMTLLTLAAALGLWAWPIKKRSVEP